MKETSTQSADEMFEHKMESELPQGGKIEEIVEIEM